jgi:hypothetical protein
LIQAQGYLVQIGLRIAGRVGSLGQLLSQQAVDVFACAAQPGAEAGSTKDRVRKAMIVVGVGRIAMKKPDTK